MTIRDEHGIVFFCYLAFVLVLLKPFRSVIYFKKMLDIDDPSAEKTSKNLMGTRWSPLWTWICCFRCLEEVSVTLESSESSTGCAF